MYKISQISQVSITSNEATICNQVPVKDTILIIADGSSIYDLINMTLYFAVFIG